MNRLLMVILVMMIWACEGNPTGGKTIAKYYDLDSLIRNQVIWLDQAEPTLLKYALIDQKADTTKFEPDSAQWAKEMAIFLQLDINRPVLRDSYTINNNQENSGNVLIYEAYEKDEVEIDYLKVYFNKASQLTRIEGLFKDQSLLYRSSRHLLLNFQSDSEKVRLSSYKVDGQQKIIFQDKVKLMVEGKVIY
ncbi:MAG: hypothetical protein ACNS62_04330 [Candidatus Cyclobacteriaceae bacterium M3_2C_046]